MIRDSDLILTKGIHAHQNSGSYRVINKHASLTEAGGIGINIRKAVVEGDTPGESFTTKSSSSLKKENDSCHRESPN